MYFNRLSITLLCLTALSTFYCSKAAEPKNLKTELVQVLFRHGARAPISCETKFLWGNNKTLYEPWGMAQLTNQGMMQEYQIGEMLRKRYNNILTNKYKPEYVYAYASGISRTKASLELVLASLFPPSNRLIWNHDLRWLPIPTFYNPRPMDILIKSRDCPKYKQVFKDLFNLTEIKEKSSKHNDIFEIMEKIHGKKLDYNELFCAYNAIFVHKNMNLPLPSWYSDEIFAKLYDAGKFYLDALSYTNNLKRLNGGPLVRRFVENIKNSESKAEGRKIYLYSAHDKTLSAFTKAHNLTLTNTPDYGSAVILEKLRDENNKLYVRLLLWSGEPKTLRTLKLDNCTEICDVDKYFKIVQPILPSDDEMLCLFKNIHSKDIEKILNTDFVNVDD